MTRKEKVRRMVRLLAVADSKGLPVPVLDSPVLNRAVIALADSIRAEKTARRYRRSDNRRAVMAA